MRKRPVPSSGSPTSGRPRISSQPSRSISNGFIRTSEAGNGQLELCWSIAFEIASRFFASALTARTVAMRPGLPRPAAVLRSAAMGSERLYGDPSSWEHAIAHVDMDAFFVSCELLRRPKLRGLPVAVGPRGDRGVVTAASYEARAFGVHSALPISIARRRCPQLIVVPPDRDLYRRGSRAVMGVLGEFSDTVEVLGLDEAYVDLSDSPAPEDPRPTAQAADPRSARDSPARSASGRTG